MVKCRSRLREFEDDQVRRNKPDVLRNLQLLDQLYREARALKALPLKEPLQFSHSFAITAPISGTALSDGHSHGIAVHGDQRPHIGTDLIGILEAGLACRRLTFFPGDLIT